MSARVRLHPGSIAARAPGDTRCRTAARLAWRTCASCATSTLQRLTLFPPRQHSKWENVGRDQLGRKTPPGCTTFLAHLATCRRQHRCENNPAAALQGRSFPPARKTLAPVPPDSPSLLMSLFAPQRCSPRSIGNVDEMVWNPSLLGQRDFVGADVETAINGGRIAVDNLAPAARRERHRQRALAGRRRPEDRDECRPSISH